MLGRDIIPINRVEILALCRLGWLAPPSHLKTPDLSCSVFANAWLVCIVADNDKLSLLFPGPRVSQAASNTFAFDETPPGRITALGGIVPLRIALESGLGNTTFLWPGIVCNNHNHEFSDTLINQIFHEQQPSNCRRNTIPPLAIIFAINWSVGYWWRRSGY